MFAPRYHMQIAGKWVRGRRRGMNNLHVTKSHHADSLPDTQAYTRRHTTVETLNAIGVVDVLECPANIQVLRSVGVVLLALHFNADHLNRLVPGGETTTQTGCQDLFQGGQLLAVVLAGELANAHFRRTGETETGAPVGGLADRNGIDTTVDTPDALLTVDIHEGLEGARGLHTLCGHLVLGDFDRLHAGAEPHGGIRLGHTTGHTAGNTRQEVRSAKHLGTVFRLRRNEEKDSTFGGSLNPGPRNETLIICMGISTCKLTPPHTGHGQKG